MEQDFSDCYKKLYKHFEPVLVKDYKPSTKLLIKSFFLNLFKPLKSK